MDKLWPVRILLISCCLLLVSGPVTAWESAAVQNLHNSDLSAYNQYLSYMRSGDKMLINEKYPAKAKPLYEAANALCPDDPVAMAGLGRACRETGDAFGAEYWTDNAQNQALKDHQNGKIDDKDYYGFASKVSNEQMKTAELRLAECKDDNCRTNYRQEIERFKQDKANFDLKKAEAETGASDLLNFLGLPEPVFGVLIGLCGAALLVVRRRSP
jgi:hypothetical protein